MLHAAWMITYALILLVICVAVTIVCCASFLRATNPLLLFILFVFFAASELAFGLMVAAFFNNAKIAGIVAPLAHFACLLPRYIFFRAEAPQVLPVDTCLKLCSFKTYFILFVLGLRLCTLTLNSKPQLDKI